MKNGTRRTFGLPPERDIQKIWEVAEERLGIDRGIFSIVHESRYLPESGMLEKPVQFFEIRVRGKGGGRTKPNRAEVTKNERFRLIAEEAQKQIAFFHLRTAKYTAETIGVKFPDEFDGKDLFVHFRKGTKDIRLGMHQAMHGGDVFVIREPEDFNFTFNVRVEGEWFAVDVNGHWGHGRESLEKVKKELAEQVGSHGEPRLWRGLRQIQEDDVLGEETLTLDWTDQKRTCKITIAGETSKTVVDNAEEIIKFIEAEYGLEDLYMCNAETGEPVDYRTNFDGGDFTVHQAFDRLKENRTVRPEEEKAERIIDGTGAEIRDWIEKQVGCPVDLMVIREGLITVFKEVELDQR
jgi:hypothetical protein